MQGGQRGCGEDHRAQDVGEQQGMELPTGAARKSGPRVGCTAPSCLGRGGSGGCAELVRATLQEDAARAARLRRAQEDYQAQDEHAGGQQGNEMLALLGGRAGGAGSAAAAAREKEKQERREDADTETGVRSRALLGSTPVISFTVEVSYVKTEVRPKDCA